MCKRTIFDGIAEGKILENQEMNLRRTSEIIGCSFDKGARDVTRVFFGTTASEEDLLFLDEGLFEAEKAEGQAAKLPGKVAAPQGAAVVTASEQGAAAVEAYQGIPYSAIIKKYWELSYEGHEPCLGDRNVKTYEICLQMRSTCDFSKDILEKVIPKYDNFPEDEWRRTIESALNEPHKGMPYRITQVLKALREERKLKYLAIGANKGDDEDDSNVKGARMPQRPQRMPRFLKLISSKVPEKFKAMVEEAIWPSLCALLHGVKFKYID